MADWTKEVGSHLGSSHDKPKKEIKEIRVRKSHNGGHVITHEHHHPEHHPNETHTTKGDDALAEHMLQHAGTPNPGEQEADPTGGAAAGADPNAAPAQMTAAPSPAGSGAPPAAAAAAPVGA